MSNQPCNQVPIDNCGVGDYSYCIINETNNTKVCEDKSPCNEVPLDNCGRGSYDNCVKNVNETDNTEVCEDKLPCNEVPLDNCGVGSYSNCVYNYDTLICENRVSLSDRACPFEPDDLKCKKQDNYNNNDNLIGVCVSDIFYPVQSCSNYKETVCGGTYFDNPCLNEEERNNFQKPDQDLSLLETPNTILYAGVSGTNTRTPTQPTTQAPTQAPTQPTTQTPTQATTQTPTQATTQTPTQATTQTPTQPGAPNEKLDCSRLENLACKDTGNQQLVGFCASNTFFPLEECDTSVCNGTFYSAPCANTTRNNKTGMPTEMSQKNNTSTEIAEGAYNSEMTEYKTSTGLEAANEIVVNELHKNVESIKKNKKHEEEIESGKTPISYYIHEVSENGEIKLYEYEYDDYNALMEMKEKEEQVKKNMKKVEGKKLLTDNRGVKYYYNPKTDSLTSYKDNKSVDRRLENLKERVKAVDNGNGNENELNMPKLDKDSIVYLNNNFGNGKHPDATTEVSKEKTGKVDEVKVSSKEAQKIIKNNKASQEEAMEEMEEEEAVVAEKVKKLTPVKSPSLSTFDKVAIALFVLILVGLLIWFLNDRFHFLPNPFKSNLKSNQGNNSSKFKVLSNYNRVLSKVRRNLN
jgi:hypothetical protein